MQKTAFKLSPSRIYTFFLAATFIASIVIVMLVSMPLWVRIMGVLLVAAYGAMIFWRYALLRSSLSIIGLQQIEGDQWRVTTCEGQAEVKLRGDSTVTPIVSILRFDFSGKRLPVSCMVFKDSLAGDDYRRLVSVIRMG